MDKSLYPMIAQAILSQVLLIRKIFSYYKCNVKYWICIVEILHRGLKDKICTIEVISSVILSSYD